MAAPFPLDKLPIPVRDDYGRAFSNSFQRTPMDDGQFRTRSMYGKQPEKISLTWKLNWEQLQFFEGWVEYDLDGGVAWFDLALSPALPTETYSFLAPGPNYAFNENTNNWVVTVEVRTLAPAPLIQQIGYLPTWPALLPEPEKSGYSFSVPDHITYGNVEGGESGARRRFTDKLTNYRARWILDSVQVDLFRAFVKEQLANGLAYFMAPFANGMGATQLKARFTSPPNYTPLGAIWMVTAQLETTFAPLISKIMYELGGKLSFADTIALTDRITILRTGMGFINDQIFLSDSMARLLRLSDSAELAEALRKRFGNSTQDAVVFAESLQFKTRPYRNDNITVTDLLRWAYTKRVGETVTLAETRMITVQYRRGILLDAVRFGEDQLSFISEYGRTLQDSVQPYDTGTACWQDYAEDYFAEDYVQTCRSWGDIQDNVQLLETITINSTTRFSDSVSLQETDLLFNHRKPVTDSITLQEVIIPTIRITRDLPETVTLVAGGRVELQDYAVDYFEEDYVTTATPLLN